MPPVTMSVNPMDGEDGRNPDKPGMSSFAITPSDTDQLATGARLIYVGVAGDIKLSCLEDPASHAGVVFKAVPAGTLLRVTARQVYASGTTATNLVGLT